MNVVYEFLLAIIIFIIANLFWTSFLSKKIYKKEQIKLLKSKPDFIPLTILHIIYIIGLVFFVLNPSITTNSLDFALIGGFLFGFITYSTYDLTNLATLKDWRCYMTIIDIFWGSILTGIVSLIVFTVFTH